MSKDKPRERVAVRHPQGRPVVHVSPERAQVLLRRGYQLVAPATTLQGDAVAETLDEMKRPALNVRARELGIPAVGTNDELREAIREASSTPAEPEPEPAAASAQADEDEDEE